MRFINGDIQISTAIDCIEKAIKYYKTPKMDLSIIEKTIFVTFYINVFKFKFSLKELFIQEEEINDLGQLLLFKQI